MVLKVRRAYRFSLYAFRTFVSVARVQIPRTCPRRNILTYARLLLRVFPGRRLANAFEGKLLKPGAVIDEADLWPTADYPVVPLLLEYAGSAQSKGGHNRSHDTYLLWRYTLGDHGAEWVEIVRTTSERAEWVEHLKPIALAELARERAPERPAADTRGIIGRVLDALDRELEMLGPGDRHLVMASIYQEFSARAVAFA